MDETVEVSESRVVEVLTAFAPIADYRLIGPHMYARNAEGHWRVLHLRDDRLAVAARQYLRRLGTPVFASAAEGLGP